MESAGLNSHRAPAWLGSAMFSATGQGWQTAILRDPSSCYRFGESFFFSNPPTGNVQAVVIKGYGWGGKNLHYVIFWEYTPPLAPPECVAWAKSAAVLG